MIRIMNYLKIGAQSVVDTRFVVHVIPAIFLLFQQVCMRIENTTEWEQACARR